MSRIPTKYITCQPRMSQRKNAPANNAITGSFAPQGMNVVSIAVALLSLSSRIVRLAMMPGIPHPVPMMIGMMDLPDRPTRLKIGVHNNADTRHISAVFQKCDQEVHYHYQWQETDYGANTTRRYRLPGIACSSGDPPSSSPDTYPWNVSIQPTSQSAIRVPQPWTGKPRILPT